MELHQAQLQYAAYSAYVCITLLIQPSLSPIRLTSRRSYFSHSFLVRMVPLFANLTGIAGRMCTVVQPHPLLAKRLHLLQGRHRPNLVPHHSNNSPWTQPLIRNTGALVFTLHITIFLTTSIIQGSIWLRRELARVQEVARTSLRSVLPTGGSTTWSIVRSTTATDECTPASTLRC